VLAAVVVSLGLGASVSHRRRIGAWRLGLRSRCCPTARPALEVRHEHRGQVSVAGETVRDTLVVSAHALDVEAS
jgi:hypothetical protein